MPKSCVGVLGARSFVGRYVLELGVGQGYELVAFSRKVMRADLPDSNVKWRTFDETGQLGESRITDWVSVAPIWVLPEYFPLLEAYGVRRVVVLSSTSRFTKLDSSDAKELELSHRLEHSEISVQAWAERSGVELTILRPTLIYGDGKDKNVAEIARFIQRFGFFPVLGKAKGLRQPIHAEDVAMACLLALKEGGLAPAYNISGGETLSYMEMVRRVFATLGRRRRVFSIPVSIFKLAIAGVRCLPGRREWSVGMAERMAKDLVFDHGAAARDFGFSPRSFHLSAKDLPGQNNSLTKNG